MSEPNDLLDLLDNRQMPDSAHPNVTLGELREARATLLARLREEVSRKMAHALDVVEQQDDERDKAFGLGRMAGHAEVLAILDDHARQEAAK